MTGDASWGLLGGAVLAQLALIGLLWWLVMTEPTAVTSRGWANSESDSAGSGAKGGRAPRSQFGDGQEPPKQRAAIIVNPTKFTSPERVKDTLTQICERMGWSAPLWLETTAEDPGTGQTREAIEAGVDVVCALGGDGTVRTVGAELVGTGVPMGLLPGGTGNLLARNLDLPAEDIAKAMKIVLSGRNQRIDSVTATITRPAEEVETDSDEATAEPQGELKTTEHIFFVMAGMGFDAEVMAGVEEDLKDKVGWLAYVVSGAKNLKGLPSAQT
ncbi:diacylglycerol kinase family protein [Ornithinimicrobium sp. INDO-MA30-4]|uniref:diacylglycerol/lipid kinase family protein n=1 Tax=Ornithinimicrobium sp. INDO-MA30-4 TaxID=2908651 RepID=UPI001F15BEB4|nr:diacylglycerol kinase family protein [Ornithinimicrobium sp. INDO-MA30-4]UJH69822.1 hypothetical protein L0A91_11220 [Ornithinimicrobium sp. INDO-MA30-4]